MKERTCVVCRTKAGRSSFFRIGRTADGTMFIGEGGRGAYVCRSMRCIDNLYSKPRLGHFLRIKQDNASEKELVLALRERLSEE